jgi:hypothetical protein
MGASSGPLALIYDATGSYTPGLLNLVATWALAIVPLFVAHRHAHRRTACPAVIRAERPIHSGPT